MYPRSPSDISETEVFINESILVNGNGSELRLVVLKKESQEFLGCAGIHGITGQTPELGIWLKQAAHGNQYGLEVITAIKKWADGNLNYECLIYPVDRRNIASRKIPEALGGIIFTEYDTKNLSGNILHILEYKIIPN